MVMTWCEMVGSHLIEDMTRGVTASHEDLRIFFFLVVWWDWISCLDPMRSIFDIPYLHD